MKVLLDCWSFLSSWDLLSSRREKSRRDGFMGFHLQPLLLLAPDQPSAGLASMMLSSERVFPNFVSSKANAFFSPRRLLTPPYAHEILVNRCVQELTLVRLNTWLWLLLLPSLAKAAILLKHKTWQVCTCTDLFLGSLYYTHLQRCCHLCFLHIHSPLGKPRIAKLHIASEVIYL